MPPRIFKILSSKLSASPGRPQGPTHGWVVTWGLIGSVELLTLRLCISGWWYTYPSEKYEFVNGKDDIPYYEMENKKYVKPPSRYINIYIHLNHIPWFPFVFFRISVLFCSRGLELGLPMAQFFNFRVPFLFPRHGSFLETETIWNLFRGRWFLQPWRESRVPVKMPWVTLKFSPFKDAVFGAPPAWHCRSFQTQVSHFASDPGRIGYWKRFKKTWTCEVNDVKYISMII